MGYYVPSKQGKGTVLQIIHDHGHLQQKNRRLGSLDGGKRGICGHIGGKAVVSEKIHKKPLVLHSDNGPAMKAVTLKVKLESLCITASYSRPRVSNDNPYPESLFRTCKYRPDYPAKGLLSIQEAREWVHRFVCWYNNEHYHSGINFVTPNMRHEGKAEAVMQKRKELYESKRKEYPERWANGIRCWELPDEVALNPTDTYREENKK